MYDNTLIINSNKKHKYTFIMLHPMCSDATYFNDYITYFKNNCIIANTIKFILPQSPFIDVDYPNNKQYCVASWYNYYSCFGYSNYYKCGSIFFQY